MSYPDEWSEMALQEIAALARGKFSARPRNDPKFFGGEYPFVQTGDVRNAHVNLKEYSQTLNEAGLRVSKLFPKGTLLFTIAANIGEVAFLGFDAACPDSLIAIRPKAGTSEIWLYYQLGFLQSAFEAAATQNAQLNINLEKLNPFRIPYPPLKEQEAIAEALSDADALIEELQRLIAKKRLIKQGAMQDLLTAKRRLPGFSGHWDSFLIGDFLNFKNGLNKAKSFFGHGTPIVNYMDVFGGGRIDAGSIVGLVEVTTAEQSAYGVKDGDILFTRTSETPDEIGLAAVADGVPEGTVFSGFVLRGRPQNEKLTRNFTKYCFRSEPIRRQIISRATYTTRALTNGRQLSQVEIYAPNDADEQDAIASVLIDMDAEIRALDTRLDKARQLKEGMMQNLLTGRIRLV